MSEQPWALTRAHRIRWSECDIYAHVNHAAYLTLFEDMRIAHWEALTGAPINAAAFGPVVAQIEARYLRSAGFNDDVTLCVRVSGFRRTSFVHEYTLLKGGEPYCTARAVCVVTRQDTGEKVALPEEVRAKLIAEGAAAG